MLVGLLMFKWEVYRGYWCVILEYDFEEMREMKIVIDVNLVFIVG